MLQENRSFDSYFGKMTAYRAANGIAGTVDDLDSGKYQNSGIAPVTSRSITERIPERCSRTISHAAAS